MVLIDQNVELELVGLLTIGFQELQMKVLLVKIYLLQAGVLKLQHLFSYQKAGVHKLLCDIMEECLLHKVILDHDMDLIYHFKSLFGIRKEHFLFV